MSCMTPEPSEPDDAIESIGFSDTPDIEKLRKECRQTWTEKADPKADWWPLRGGPADGETAPRSGPTFSGNWVNDKCDVVLLTYEWVKHDEEWYGEFAGMSNTRLLADQTMEASFDQERGEPEPEMVDLEAMTVDEALAFLIEDNERRITEFFEISDGQIDLEHAVDLDVKFIRIFVNRILGFMSPKMHTEASLEYENHRSRHIDEIEDKYNKFQDEREQAMAQARLSMQGPPPGMPAPGAMERVKLPPRRVRRGG